jgi:preprotein translocase subunit SecE
MPTIIDSLVVTLGLDSSGFKKGQTEVKKGLDDTRKNADQTAKDMEAAGKRAASFFGSIRTELLALVGVTLSAQGIKTFITNMTSDLMRLGIESRALDISAKSLDGWERAAAAAGSTAERMAGTLGNFQKTLTNIRTGGGQDDPLFGALASFAGATGANFDYQNDNAEKIMRKIASNWGKLSKDAQRRFGGMFGFDNATQQGLANGSLVQDADRFAKISRATDEATRKALEFNRRLEQMKQNFAAASQVLYEALIPYIEKIIPLIEKFGIWISTHGPEISKFFSNTADEINKVVDAVGGLENALKLLLVFVGGKWLLGMTSSIGGVKGALTALGRVSMIAGLVELQKYAEKLENKYAWLKDNPVTNFLNSGAGTDTTTEWGKQLHDWIFDKTGIELPRGDGYKSAPRGIRNNNPGNLNYVGQAGATMEGGEGGRFAVFESMQHGVAALYKQLQLYFKRGINTLSSIVKTYAPASDNNNVDAYISALTKATGKGANEVLDSGDTATIARLMKGIVDHENGKGYISSSDIMGGIQLGAGSSASRNMPAAAGSQTNINIGKIDMQTSAGNANALGADIQRNLQRNRLVNPAMSGQG